MSYIKHNSAVVRWEPTRPQKSGARANRDKGPTLAPIKLESYLKRLANLFNVLSQVLLLCPYPLMSSPRNLDRHILPHNLTPSVETDRRLFI